MSTLTDGTLADFRRLSDRYKAATGSEEAWLAHQLAVQVPKLLGEVERLRAELDDEKATHAKTFSNFEAFAEDRAFSNDAASVSAVLCLRCCPAVLLGTEEIQRHNEMLHAAGGDSTDAP